MLTVQRDDLDLKPSWIEGDADARWRSATGMSPANGSRHLGNSLLELDRGCRLPRHTDSAEEVVVVLRGRAEVKVGTEREVLDEGGAALVPEGVPHEVRNIGDGTLRFLAQYAGTDVTTTYEQPVQPAGDPQSRPLG